MAMARDDQNPDDLEQTVRQRLRAQNVDGSFDPTASANDGGSSQPIEAAPFQSPDYTPPDPPPVVPPQSQPTPAPAPSAPAAFSGGGAPPQPQDPYYAAYNAQNNITNAPAPVGTQLNFDNTPFAPAAGGYDANKLTSIVQSWPNPYGHQDPSYWVNKILAANEFKTDPEGVINYFRGRYLQDPNNNPESLQNRAPIAANTGNPAATGAFAGLGDPNGSIAERYAASISNPQSLWSQDFLAQLRQMLMTRLAATQQPVDPNDPSIQVPLTAARDEATRATEKERTDLAEQAYAHGDLNTDRLSQQLQQSGERNAIGLGSLRATLMSREIQSRRDELKSLLQMSLAAGDAGSMREIQQQLAALDALEKEQAANIDLEKFGQDLNYRYTALGAGA